MQTSNKKELSIFKPVEWHVKVRKWWTVIVLAFLALILGAFIFNFVTFWDSNENDPLQNVPVASDSLKLDRAKLDSVLQKFEQKALNSETVLNSKSPVTDPSI